MSGDAFGSPTTRPWAIKLWEAYRHPTQIYETIGAAIIVVILWRCPLGKAGEGVNFVWALPSRRRLASFLKRFGATA